MKYLLTLVMFWLAISLQAQELLDNLPSSTPDLSSFPVTITNCERALTFDAPPERVVGLWQPSNELLLALGVEDRILAFAGFYTETLPEFTDIVASKPSLGESTTWPSRELLLSQEADLVVSEGLSGFAYDPANGYASVEDLEAAGAQVLSTGSSCDPMNPGEKSIETVYEDLETLGKIFGVSERAEALIARLREQENTVREAVAGLGPKDVIFYNGGEGPLFVLGYGIWQDAIEKAGGTSLAPTTGWNMSVEEFAAAQPEVILIGTFPGQDIESLKTFLTETFPSVPAVQSDQLYEIPTILTEASIRIMDGYEAIAKAIHPKAFSE
jgi:iron complex transport system substrate-binding protein